MVRVAVKRRQSVLAWLAVAGLVALQAQLLQPTVVSDTSGPGQASLESAYAHLPLAFEPNEGQAGDGVDFLVHHGQAVTAFSGTSSTTSLGDKQVTMSLDGANSSSFTGQDELQSKTNYFLGNDQSQWHGDIPNFQKLLATNVYPGIDLAYYGTNSTLEHDFIVSPNADYRQIAFNFSGQDDLSQDNDGNLVLKAGDEQLQLNAPTTYQLGDHSKHTIPSKFEVNDGTVTVAVTGEYDHAKPLVIDPTLNLIYSTYLGGSGDDTGDSVSVDPSGNVYVVGSTTSSNFPTSAPFQASTGGGASDLFVAKLNPAGTALVYATYLGGSGEEINARVASDINGNAYVTGGTGSSNFPTASPLQGTYGGGLHDAFITKLNAAGSALVFSTFLGGSGDDNGSGGADAIAVDGSGAVYVAGETNSTNFPTASPFQASKSTGQDAFVSKLNAAGSALTYSTYLGGNGLIDLGSGIDVDTSGNAYVVGLTNSTNFPTASPFQASNAGTFDAFVTKFNAAGSALTYSTYLGGTGDDRGFGIAVNAGTGEAYVTGKAEAAFPTSSPLQGAYGGSGDAFITRLNAAGSALTYSTYIGGSGADEAYNIDIDSSGNAVIAGYTDSTNFPTSSPYQAARSGSSDAFVSKVNAAGSAYVYSTYLGGSGVDFANSVALDLSGDAFVAGHAESTDFPVVSALQSSKTGGTDDAFLAQLTEHTVNLTARVNPTLTFTVGSTTCALGTLSTTQTQQCTYTLTAATNGTSGYSISYLPAVTLTSGANTISALLSPTASTLNAEQFGINLAANTAAGSHTAANFGAAPSGGSGTASANYTTANSFKLATGGETIATATSPSLTTTYTISTIANIANTTEAGTYTTTFTYTIVSTY